MKSKMVVALATSLYYLISFSIIYQHTNTYYYIDSPQYKNPILSICKNRSNNLRIGFCISYLRSYLAPVVTHVLLVEQSKHSPYF